MQRRKTSIVPPGNVSAIGLGCMVKDLIQQGKAKHFGMSEAGAKTIRRAHADDKTSFVSTDFRNIVPRFTPEARKANQAVVDLLRAIAERKHATPAQVALAWRRRRGRDSERLYFAPVNFDGNCAMIPSLSTSAIPRMCCTTRS